MTLEHGCKKILGKAFLYSSLTIVAGMVYATARILLTEGFVLTDVFAAPLLGFYVSIRWFIVVFPVIVFFLFIKSYLKR